LLVETSQNAYSKKYIEKKRLRLFKRIGLRAGYLSLRTAGGASDKH